MVLKGESDMLGSMSIALAFGVVLLKVYEWLKYTFVTFWIVNGASILLFIAKLIGIILLGYFLYRIAFSFYQIYWVQMDEAKRDISKIKTELEEETSSLRHCVRSLEWDCSDLSRKVQVLAKNTMKLKKFTGLDEVEKIEKAKKKVQKTMGAIDESDS
ncbi:MAG: hypothetical protein KDD45_04075 [Bdellovibrionales bacterium]|nr:hypothetical protein [Bdellovibrionales bacterium]